VVVERHLGHAGLGQNLLDASRMEAVAVEQLECSLDEFNCRFPRAMNVLSFLHTD